MASRISSWLEPEPPWNTKLIGFSTERLNLFFTYSCELCRIFGCNFTLPGLYTPCTLPKAAATVKRGLTFNKCSYEYETSSGWVYKRELSTSELSTPSSSPPVTPNSISSVIPILVIRSRYLADISIFSSIGSSERSSMCDENNGLPVSLKNFSPWSNKPSIQGNNFLAAWSVCKITATP